MNLSKHFQRSEFACKCHCGFSTVDAELLNTLERVRDYFNSPVTINSGCRCYNHNSNIGGSSHSKHCFGIAADFTVKDHTPEEVYEFINRYEPESYGLGLYKSWVHLDVRSTKARWKR